MDDAEYYRTAIPEPWTILGLRLKPFCLGHVLILSRFESPFITDPISAISADLVFAVFICSRTYEEALAAMDDPGWVDFVQSWSKQLQKPRFLQRIGLEAPTEINWAEKFKAFARYMSDGSKHPDYQVPETRFGGSFGLPLVQIVKCVLLSKTNLTESEIMNRPWGLALTDYITLRAMDGAVEIVDGSAIETALKQANDLYEKLNKKVTVDGSGSEMQN